MQANGKKLFLVLGFGGVIAPARVSWNYPKDSVPGAADYLDVVILRNLAKFCKETGAEIIMATPWTEKLPMAADWEALFRQLGVELPVAHALPANVDSWFTVRDHLSKEQPNAEWFCFADGTRPPPGEYRVAIVDPTVGISPLDLLAAAEVLAPQSQTAQDLRDLVDTFDPKYRLPRNRC